MKRKEKEKENNTKMGQDCRPTDEIISDGIIIKMEKERESWIST